MKVPSLRRSFSLQIENLEAFLQVTRDFRGGGYRIHKKKPRSDVEKKFNIHHLLSRFGIRTKSQFVLDICSFFSVCRRNETCYFEFEHLLKIIDE